ncbi:HK97 gp10 family phage protein [Phyllobacterium sp. 628]|uniref:HK97-gp10 family putative phage morphogenesis protein n=1 Tax=Phyllobacterium sp. 628 TaxID=2718938 RepID=UPI00166225CD|nr:HK97-gp10 family putative phage morphogenesis protein [Phyllobacterium sp. 628]QND51532.1 HK97 gp10 family phage protein [Phyllobacterium sp. 628]
MADDGGLARVQRKMLAMAKAGETAMRQAMETGANEIVAMMKSLVPVDKGDLKLSIGWTWGKAPKGSISMGTLNATKGNAAITIYAGDDKAFYAKWVEFGTKNAAASPYFYVSYRANKKRFTRRVNTAVSKAVRKVWNGNG